MFKLITAAVAAVVGLGAVQVSARDQESRAFRLVNRSDYTITQVIASNIGEGTFVPVDLLGAYKVGPHQSLVIAPFNDEGWCRFDIRMTFANGDQQEVYDVNVCEATSVTTYGGYATATYPRSLGGGRLP